MSQKARMWQTLIVLNLVLVVGLIIGVSVQGASISDLLGDPSILWRGFNVDIMPGGS